METERTEVSAFSEEETRGAWETWRADAWEGSVGRESWTIASSVAAEGRGCSGAGWGENIASVTGSGDGAAETETCDSDSVGIERAVINKFLPLENIYLYLRLGDGERRRRGGEGERRLRPGEGDRLFLETQTLNDEFSA